MDAEQIRKALFPHEETIKRLQADNEALRMQVETLTKELANVKAHQSVSEETTPAKRTGKAKAKSSQSDELGDAGREAEA